MAWRGIPFRSSRALLVALALLGGAWCFLLPSVLTLLLRGQTAQIRAQMAEALQAQVVFHDIAFHGWRGVVLDDVTLAPSTPGAGQALIRVKAMVLTPRMRFWPRLAVELSTVTLVEPALAVQGDPESLRLLQRAIQLPPQTLVQRPLPVILHPRTLRVRRGQLTMLTPAHPLGPAGQLQFERVEAVLAEARWIFPAHFAIDGILGADAGSRLRIQGAVHRRRGETTRVDVAIRGRRFNAAQINPYVEDVVHFPEGSVDGDVKVWFTPDGRIASSGRVKGRDLGTAQPGLWGRLLRLVSPSVSYELKGRWAPERLQAEEVTVRTAGLRFAGRAEVRLDEHQTRYAAEIASGKIPTKTLRWLFPNLEFRSGQLNLRIALEGTQERLVPHFIFVVEDSTIVDAVHRMTLSKIGGTLDVTQERTLIERLDAFVNDVPVRLHLDVSTAALPAAITLSVETYPQQLASLRKTNPWVVRARLQGQYQPPYFTGAIEGQVSASIPGQADAQPVRFAVPAVTVQLPAELNWARLRTQGVGVAAPELLIQPPSTEGEAPGLTIHGLTAQALFDQNQVRVKELAGKLCQGAFLGKAYVDARTVPGTWEVTVRVDHLQLLELWQGLGRTPLVSGELAFDGRIAQTRGGPQLRGWVQVLNGQVQQLTVLGTLAQETGIEPLHTLAFREMAATVRFADNTVTVEPFTLEGELAKLRSTCRIGLDLRLAGELSAQFPQEAVNRSSKLRWLMRFVAADPWVDFDFKLAGSLKTLRIQWLPGEFKKRIQDKLSPGLLRMLEEEMDKMLSTPSA